MNTKEKYNVIIVDDEYLAQKLLQDYVSKVESLQLVATCSNAIEAMSSVHQVLIGDGQRTQFVTTVLCFLPTVGPFTTEVHHLEIAGTVQGVARHLGKG